MHLTAFQNTLNSVLEMSATDNEERIIAEKLLELEDLKIEFNTATNVINNLNLRS